MGEVNLLKIDIKNASESALVASSDDRCSWLRD